MANTEKAAGWAPPAQGGRWTRADGRAMVESYRSSGLKVGAFARLHGLNSQRVNYWLEGAETKDTSAPTSRKARAGAAVTFAPIRIVGAPSDVGPRAVLEVAVGGAVVRVPQGFDEQHLRRVVVALGGGSC